MAGYRVAARALNTADSYSSKRDNSTGRDGVVDGGREHPEGSRSMSGFPTSHVSGMSLQLGYKVYSRALEGKGARGQRATKEHVGEGAIIGQYISNGNKKSLGGKGVGRALGGVEVCVTRDE